MYRVLIADDHAFTRFGLRSFLLQTGLVSETGEARDGMEALRKLRSEGPWQVLVLDLEMPQRGGLDILRNLRASFPETRVLVVSGFPEQQFALQAIRAGAHGYLPKGSLVEDYRAAIEAIVAGRKYISAALAEQLAAGLGDPTPQGGKPAHETLNERQFQVFCKLALGRGTESIASEMCIGRKTVSTYRSQVYQRLKVRNQAGLMQYAREVGLVD